LFHGHSFISIRLKDQGSGWEKFLDKDQFRIQEIYMEGGILNCFFPRIFHLCVREDEMSQVVVVTTATTAATETEGT